MQITMMPVSKIFGHPNNPRTSNGDLTELAASIKEKGILQNLIVVPYSPTDHAGLSVPDDGGDYYVAVAGNRRLAAAKLAKLTEVPVVIYSADLKDQTQIALIENLQRDTVTPYQQGKAFRQLVMDLGVSVSDIAKQTGFSEATIRNRVKLSVFDPDKMTEVEGRNASMKDYLDLAKIEDEALRNEVLGSIGTSDFRNHLARAKTTLRDRKNKAELITVLSSFATKKEQADVNAAGMVLVSTYYVSDTAEKVKIPVDKDTVSYVFTENYGLQLWRPKTAKDNEKDNAKKKQDAEIQACRESIKAASDRAAGLRKDFLMQVSDAAVRQHFDALVSALGARFFNLAAQGHTKVPVNYNILRELAGIGQNSVGAVDLSELEFAANKQPRWTMFALGCAMLENGAYFVDAWQSIPGRTGVYIATHVKNSGLDSLYKLLTALGYEMSEEEKQLQNGSHPMFYKLPAKSA